MMHMPPRPLQTKLLTRIFPAVKYGVVLWGSCCNSDLANSIERLHCRTARIIYNLPKDMASVDLPRHVQ